MDEINLRILRALEENARTPNAELGRKIGLSQTAIGDRVHRMEDDGIIAGYSALVNPAKLGFNVRAYLCLHAERDSFSKLIALARSTPEVKELHHTSGKSSFLARVIARDEPDLERVVRAFAQFGKVETERIMSSPVEKRTT